MKVVEIVTRLGMARTDIVRLPLKGGKNENRFKDINECLQSGVTPELSHNACLRRRFSSRTS